MTEDELLAGILDACAVGGWRFHHIRRSDLALQQGQGGFPDIFALHPERGLAFVAELKAEHGRLEPLQRDWLEAFDRCGIRACVLRPNAYDETVRWLIGPKLKERRP